MRSVPVGSWGFVTCLSACSTPLVVGESYPDASPRDVAPNDAPPPPEDVIVPPPPEDVTSPVDVVVAPPPPGDVAFPEESVMPPDVVDVVTPREDVRDAAETCAPSAEACNNVDDDCDGAIDEELTRTCYNGPAGTQGVGLCRAGTQTCAAGAWGACAGQVLPSPEVCNRLDDNCNSGADEGLTCP